MYVTAEGSKNLQSLGGGGNNESCCLPTWEGPALLALLALTVNGWSGGLDLASWLVKSCRSGERMKLISILVESFCVFFIVGGRNSCQLVKYE